jgi:tetratricopeptide (TPR) repeat protein
LLAIVMPGVLFTRAHVTVCRAAVETALSTESLLEELRTAGWVFQLSKDVFSFTTTQAWHRAREQGAGLTTRAVIDVATVALARQIDNGNGDGGLAVLAQAPLQSSWARASVLARWGELARAITAAPVSTPWQQFVGGAWSSLSTGRSSIDPPPPPTGSATGGPDAATSSVLAGLLLAPRDSQRAAVLIREGVTLLGAAGDDPHDDRHRARVAAARGLLMLGDLDGVDEAVAGLLPWLPADAAEQLEQLGAWRALPGVVARSVAAIENLHAIATLRSFVPRSPALGHLLVARLELLECFGRLGTADDAASVAADAVDAFQGAGPANRDPLWGARRWAAWVTLRRGDPLSATADLHTLLDEMTEILGAQDPLSVSTSEWLARCDLEAGQLGNALSRLDAVVAARLLAGQPGDPDVLSAQHWLGVCLAKSSRHADAAALLAEVVGARAGLLSADHEDLLASRQALGSALANTGRVEEALAELEDVVARRLLLDVPDAPRVVAARHSRATCLVFAGRYAEALVELEDLVAIRTEQLGPDDPLLLHVRNDRALCLLFLGRWDEALADLDDIIPRRERALGEGHLFVLLARHHRATCLRALGRREQALGELDAVLGFTQSWAGDDGFRETLLRERMELVS